MAADTRTPCGHANAGVTVRIEPTAEPRHLRQMAEMLTETAQQMEARNPASATDTEAFLNGMMDAAQSGRTVSAEDVARLCRLADWADAAPAPGWNGTLDRGETARAVNAARERLALHALADGERRAA